MRRALCLSLLLACHGSSTPATPSFDAAAVEAYEMRVGAAICQLERACDLALGLSEDSARCQMDLAARWPLGLAHIVDPALAEDCLTALESFTCEEAQRDRALRFRGRILGSCFEAVSGAALPGQTCYTFEECASGSACRGLRNPDAPDALCPGTCEELPALPSAGEACTLACGPGLYCNGFCERLPAEGEACIGTLCAETLVCDDGGTCRAPSRLGDACSDRACDLGLQCVEGDCVPQAFGLEPGERCGDAGFCSRGSLCERGRCIRRAGAGETCADSVAGMPNQPCLVDLYCRSSGGEPGVCAPRGLPGDACTPLELRNGSFSPPCFGRCVEGRCVAYDAGPRACTR